MGLPIGCTVNPSSGKEMALGVGTIQPAKEKKAVLVVGGGVAGMEAARTAATRGHRVMLYEKQETLGGQLPLAASLPGRDELSDIVRWYQAQLPKVGVEIHLGEEVSPEKVDALKPDAVIVATGASYLRDGLNAPTFSPIAGWEQEHVTTPETILTGEKTAGQNVVVVDETGFIVGPGIAEWLADKGKKVELVTSDPSVGAMLFATLQLPWLYGRIMGKVTLSPNTAVIQIAGRALITINPHSGQQGQIEDVDTVVLVTGKKPDDALYKALKGQFPEVYIAGDCDRAPHAVFGIGEAIGSGHRVGRII
jgi:thioredoxin reductase